MPGDVLVLQAKDLLLCLFRSGDAIVGSGSKETEANSVINTILVWKQVKRGYTPLVFKRMKDQRVCSKKSFFSFLNLINDVFYIKN